MSSPEIVALLAITLIAAIVNGALGYGFSSITVPLALLFLTGRVLNPALVVLEVVLNVYVLVVNRAALPVVVRRALPVVVGLAPGVALGTWALAAVNPAWIKLVAFAALLPLALLQASGVRRALRAERTVGSMFGIGIGALYASTTISGPPLATFLTNQGLTQAEFRAALGLIRMFESSLTTLAYMRAGLLTATSLELGASILPAVLVGVPIGAWVIHRVSGESFRRWCMSFDAIIIAFAVGAVLRELKLTSSAFSYAPLALVLVLDIVILFRFAGGAARVSVGPQGGTEASIAE